MFTCRCLYRAAGDRVYLCQRVLRGYKSHCQDLQEGVCQQESQLLYYSFLSHCNLHTICTEHACVIVADSSADHIASVAGSGATETLDIDVLLGVSIHAPRFCAQ